MSRTKRKFKKENPNAIDPSKKRVKTNDDDGSEDDQPVHKQPPPPPPKFTGKKKANGAKPLSKKQLLSDKSPFPEEQDRTVEGPLYEYLGSEDSDERLQAADVIISKLLGGDGVSESTLDRHLEKRLFRGLASNRKASRLGFSVVLTEIVQQLWGEKDLCGDKYRGLTFDFVLNTLMERTKPVGNIAGQEEKDHYFGQLFGIECFVRAKIVFDDVARWHTILDLLLKLAQKKVWLKPQCAWVIVQSAPQMDQKIAEETLKKLDEAGWAKTPEAVAITVVFTERFPKIKLPSKAWRDFLSPKYLGELPAVLKDSGRSEADGQKQTQGHWTAQLHFVWDIILEHYVKLASTEAKEASDHFKQFWSRVVDQGFFSKTATDPQKFTGFVIFHKFLESGLSYPHIVRNLFSQNLVVCLINQAAQKDRYLHRAALKVLKAIERAAETNRDAVPVILPFLVGTHGVYNFDQKTNSKTVDKLLHFTKPQHASGVIKTLRQCVLGSGGDNPENHVLVYADCLFKLSTIVPSKDDIRAPGKGSVGGLALQEFTKLAYPQAGKAEAGFNDKTKTILRQKLNAALARFVKRPEDFGEFCSAIMSIDSSSVEMDDELQAELLEALEKLQELTGPNKTRGDKSGAYQGLALLYAVAILQLYNEEPDAIEILADLKQCYEKLVSQQQDDDGDVSALLVEILLAMVARPSSLMRQTADRVFEGFTSLMTSEALALLTDPLAASENAEGLRSLFDTDADMEDAEEEGGGSDKGDDDDDTEIASDVEFVDMQDADQGDDEEAEDEDNDGEESEEDEEEEDEEDEEEGADDDKYKELDDALANLLNSHRLDKDKEAASSDDDGGSDMSDSEMMALDDKISAAFRSRVKETSKKKDDKDARKTVVNFKHRALDLLAIFARNEAGSPLVLQLLVPLLRLMRATKARDLVNKAGHLLAEVPRQARKKRVKKNTKKGGDNSNSHSPQEEDDDEEEEEEEEEEDEEEEKAGAVDEQMRLLEAIHDEMIRDDSHAYAKAASKASLLVVEGLLGQDAGLFEAIWAAYGGLARKWASSGGGGGGGGGGKFQFPSIMNEFTNWIQTHPSLIPPVVATATADVDEMEE